MMAEKTTTQHKATFLVLSVWLAFFAGTLFNSAKAESDKELQEKALKAREMNQSGTAVDHSAHNNPVAVGGQFRGVFYGYLPCPDPECNGIKMTLSLNAKNKYLLVIQPAKVFNRESFEKGSYEWDDLKGMLVLTPYQDVPVRKLAIKDEGTLLYLTEESKKGDDDRYLLQRADKAGNREMHIH